VDTGMTMDPGSQRSQNLGVFMPSRPPALNVKLHNPRYLRAAQAYMLISMPTGTSTILGVFQAILALLLNRDAFPPATKVMLIKKYASEIFGKGLPFYVAMQ
jgi:hypothetical protein